MARLEVTPTTVSVRFGRGEKVAGLLRDLEVPRSAVQAAEVVADPLRQVRGLRFPGADVPGFVKIGTWRRAGERTLVSVRRGQPAVRVRLTGQRFQELLVGADDAERIAADLRSG